MRNTFGKDEDCPIPKKNDESEENLDLDDDNEQIENEINHNKSKNKFTPNQYEEFELNSNDSNNRKVIFSSDSEDNEDSDKTSEENEDKNIKKNNNNNSKNNINKKKIIIKKGESIEKKEKKEKDEKDEKDEKEDNKKKSKKYKKEESSDEESSNRSDNEEDEKENKDKKIKLRNNKVKINSKEDDEFNKTISKNKEIESLLLQSIKNKENATSQKIHMAEEINFKSIPDKIIKTDEYGFIVTNNNDNNEQDLLQINARIEKWNYMIEQKDFGKKNIRKLKSRTRKGVPDCLRSYVWQIFAEKDKYYQKDIFKKLDSIQIKEDLEIVIIKDLDRTFPACQFFKEKYGNGQRKLYKVLSNYSKYNTSTGYVQGMGFIAAVFLTYMDEESSFFMLDSLMKKYGLEGFYQPNFPKLKSTFYILLNLLKKFIPKIYELFKKEGMIPSMYASEWFICLFSRNLEFKTLVRIFDVFLLEGYKVIYRFALAFLKLKEDKFLEGKDGLASIMPTINDCYNIDDIEKLFKVAFGFSLSRNYINKLEKEYESIKDDQENEFVKQL